MAIAAGRRFNPALAGSGMTDSIRKGMKMDFYEVIATRRSIRNYKSDPIPEGTFERLARSVALAPSACNRQPWKFIVVTCPEMLKTIRAACPQRMLADVPAIVAIAGNVEDAWRRPEGDSIIGVDVGIAMEHLVLAATAEGLGTCWICAYHIDKVTRAFGLAAPWLVYALTPIGFPASPAQEITRKPVDQIFEVIR